jgi:hypothetical protein
MTAGPTSALVDADDSSGFSNSPFMVGVSGHREDSLMESYLWAIHRYHREHEPPSAGGGS